MGSLGLAILKYKTFSQRIPENITELYLAVWFKLKSIAEALFSRGWYSARERNSYGQCALAVAASRGISSTAQLFLAYTIEVDPQDRTGGDAFVFGDREWVSRPCPDLDEPWRRSKRPR
jgi:hypothetical protein